MRKPAAASVRLSSVPRCLRHVSPGIALEEAGAIASEDAGEVWVESVALDTVAGRKRYDVKCVGDGLEADYQINPESGRIIKKTIQYL